MSHVTEDVLELRLRLAEAHQVPHPVRRSSAACWTHQLTQDAHRTSRKLDKAHRIMHFVGCHVKSPRAGQLAEKIGPPGNKLNFHLFRAVPSLPYKQCTSDVT